MVSQLVLGIIAFAPGIAVLYLIGGYEEHFRHNAMFLAAIVGMALGLVVGFLELIIMADAIWWISLLAAALIEVMAMTVVVGLPRFRGNRETILLGGATGAGLAALVMTVYGQTVLTAPVTWQVITTLVSVSLGFTAIHFAAGLVLGQGPAEEALMSRFLPALALLLPTHLLLGLLGLQQDLRLRPLTNYTDVELSLGVLAYGLAVAIAMAPKLMEKSLPRDERLRRRREARG